MDVVATPLTPLICSCLFVPEPSPGLPSPPTLTLFHLLLFQSPHNTFVWRAVEGVKAMGRDPVLVP